jgi:hypothetical protein
MASQLARWPQFRRGSSPTAPVGCFANHCSNCNAPQEDMYLHDEPDDPFFSIIHFPPQTLQLTPLVGPIHFSGSYHFPI